MNTLRTVVGTILIAVGASAANVPMGGNAKCQEAIGTGGAYVFDSCPPQPGGFCHCYSKPKDGKGEPSYVTVIYPDEGAPADEPLPQERQKGKRFRLGDENNQAEGVEGFDRSARKERKKMRDDPEGDWSEGKLPKQARIEDKSKSFRRKITGD